MSFLFGSSTTVTIQLAGQEERKTIDVQTDKGTATLPVYLGEEAVKGKVLVSVKPGKKLEHQGIKIDFYGQIELFYDRGNHHQFLSLTSELAPAGILEGDKEFEFDFVSAEKTCESYNGINARLRYYLKVVIVRSILANITEERDIWVINYQDPPDVDKPIKMEIKYMEIALQRRESTGQGPNSYSESETLTKFEIMDGCPVRGESIPVRLFLGAFDLTPTYKNIHTKYSVKYYLNLVLVDEEDRRYFKQQEIILWRRAAGAHTELDANPTGRHTGPRLTAEGKPARSKKSSGTKKSSKKQASNQSDDEPSGAGAGAGAEEEDSGPEDAPATSNDAAAAAADE